MHCPLPAQLTTVKKMLRGTCMAMLPGQDTSVPNVTANTPGPGSHVCSPPVSAKGPLPQQKRRWTVKATQGCFHTKLTPSTGSWRPWTHSMTIPKPLPHSLPATAPSRPCPGTPAPSLQPGAAASCQSRDMAAAAKTHPAAASA